MQTNIGQTYPPHMQRSGPRPCGCTTPRRKTLDLHLGAPAWVHEELQPSSKYKHGGSSSLTPSSGTTWAGPASQYEREPISWELIGLTGVEDEETLRVSFLLPCLLPSFTTLPWHFYRELRCQLNLVFQTLSSDVQASIWRFACGWRRQWLTYAVSLLVHLGWKK